MRTIIVMAVLALGACSDEQNLGDSHVLHSARWAVTAGASSDFSAAWYAAIDASGDVVAAGPFHGTVDFGTSTLTTDDMNGAYWISKRSAIDGSEVWSIVSGVEIDALAVTPQREVIVAGSAGGTEAFVAKYSPAGELLWNTGLGRNSHSSARSIAVAPDGQIYLTAEFTGTIGFPDRIVSGGPSVLAALAPDGHIVWGRQLPVGGKVHSSSDGHAIVVGTVDTSTTVGDTMIDLTRDPDLFAAELDHDGALRAVHTFGEFGVRHLNVESTLDASDRIGAAANGLMRADSPLETLLDGSDHAMWSATLASGGGEAFAVATTDDSVITAGQITTDGFDPGDGAHVGDTYLTARDESGSLVDARVFGDPSLGQSDGIRALAVGPSGEVGFAGFIDQPIDFGSGPVVSSGIFEQSSLVIGVLAH